MPRDSSEKSTLLPWLAAAASMIGSAILLADRYRRHKQNRERPEDPIPLPSFTMEIPPYPQLPAPAVPLPPRKREFTFLIRFSLARPSIKQVFQSLLAMVIIAMCVIPPYMVVRERWLNDPNMRNWLIDTWCKVDFLCKTQMPSYFLIIFPLFLASLLLFVIFAPGHWDSLFPVKTPGSTIPSSIPDDQLRASRFLRVTAAAGTFLVFLIGFLFNHIPGIEMLVVILVYFAGCVLQEVRVEQIRAYLQPPKWLAPVLANQLAIIFFLFTVYSDPRPLGLSLAILVASIYYLYRERYQIPKIYWIFTGAFLVYIFKINSWEYSVIGDEFSFPSYAVEHIINQGWGNIAQNIFWGTAVYGAHPYFSSLIQAFTMLVLGQDNFGWRFSNPYLTALSLIFFYKFFRRFIDERAAFTAVIFLGASEYLIGFSKIGYNNLQALLVCSIVLLAAGKAAQDRRPLSYTMVGLAMGLCMYVYPAALYLLVLPPLLLLFFDPPFNRPAIGRWGFMLAAFSLLFLPLLFQPAYWRSKVAGTLFYSNSVIQDVGLGTHFSTNFIYSIFSYVYAEHESHFVVSAYIDPISAALLPIGLAWTLKATRRNKFAIFIILSYLVMLFLVGTTHDRMEPSTTRMFLLLPWYTLFSALAVYWLYARLGKMGSPAWFQTGLTSFIILCMVLLNIYQAYVFVRERTAGVPSLEVLFLRLQQRNEADTRSDRLTYLILNGKNEGIGGLFVLQKLYHLPQSGAQLEGGDVSSGVIPAKWMDRIQNIDTVTITRQSTDEVIRKAVEQQLTDLGKISCPVRDFPDKDVRFTMWYASNLDWICPRDGNWN